MKKVKTYAQRNIERCEERAAISRHRAERYPWARRFWIRQAVMWDDRADQWVQFRRRQIEAACVHLKPGPVAYV